MSFEERSSGEIAPAEPVHEGLELSPALSTLANQLSAEANRLAQCFPSHNADQFVAMATAVAAAKHDSRSLNRPGIIAGICAATLLVGIVGWQAFTRVNRGDAAVENPVLAREPADQLAHLNDASGFSSQASEAVGGEENFLKGLSGAEQEAVLDLMEFQAMRSTNLSI